MSLITATTPQIAANEQAYGQYGRYKVMAKSVYLCEKCGKQFDSWGECSEHEDKHKYIAVGPTDWRMGKFTKYDLDAEVPSVVFCAVEDGKDANGDTTYVVYGYKLVGQNKSLTQEYNDLLATERRQNAIDEANRQLDLAGMIEALEAEGIEVPQDKRSYWNMRDFYKQTKGISYTGVYH